MTRGNGNFQGAFLSTHNHPSIDFAMKLGNGNLQGALLNCDTKQV